MKIDLKKYSTFLFDMDGTLVDSEKLKGLALSDSCKHFGGIADVIIYKNVMGESWEVVTKYFFEKANITPNSDEFNFVFKEIYQKLLNEELTINPNAKELLQHLKSKSKKLGVVSSAPLWSIKQILAQLQLKNIFNIVITKEDVSEHKPNPAAYLLALKKLGVSNSEVLIFEDSSAGLLAAHNAKCDAIAFRHNFNINNNLSQSLEIIEDFKEIIAID